MSRADNLHHPVPWSVNLGTLNSWNTLGRSGPVMGLILFYVYTRIYKFYRPVIIFIGHVLQRMKNYFRGFCLEKFVKHCCLRHIYIYIYIYVYGTNVASGIYKYVKYTV